MAITSVAYTSTGTAVAIADDDGTTWHDDAGLPADTDLRRALADWIAQGGVIAPYAPPPVTRADLVAYAASRRWAIQTGGITVGGITVDTSDASRAMIADAVAYVQASGVASVDFKAVGGWATISAADLVAIGLAVGAHVQAAFAAERAVDAAIAAGAITTAAQIDAWAWPPNSAATFTA